MERARLLVLARLAHLAFDFCVWRRLPLVAFAFYDAFGGCWSDAEAAAPPAALGRPRLFLGVSVGAAKSI